MDILYIFLFPVIFLSILATLGNAAFLFGTVWLASRVRDPIKQALIGSAGIAISCGVGLVLFFTYIPKFREIHRDFGTELPWGTTILFRFHEICDMHPFLTMQVGTGLFVAYLTGLFILTLEYQNSRAGMLLLKIGAASLFVLEFLTTVLALLPFPKLVSSLS